VVSSVATCNLDVTVRRILVGSYLSHNISTVVILEYLTVDL